MTLADAALLSIGCLSILTAPALVLLLGRCRHRTWYLSGYLMVCEGCGKIRDRTR
jgi:hypothetical protein